MHVLICFWLMILNGWYWQWNHQLTSISSIIVYSRAVILQTTCLFVRRMHKPAKWLEFNIPVCLGLQPCSLLPEMPGKLFFFRTQVCIYERSASLSRQCIECTGVRSSGGAHFFINFSRKTNEYAKIQWWGLLLQIPMLGHKDEKSPIIP